MKLNTKQLVFLSFLIALKIVLTRFLGMDIGGIVRISFSFIATAVMAVYFGPWVTALGCGVADFIGAHLFPRGAFFPGFTLSAMLIGLIYGFLLYKKHFSWWRIIAIKLLILVFVTMGLNTLWLSMLTGRGYISILIPRVTESLLMMPVEVILLGLLQMYLIPQLMKYTRV